MTAAAPSTGTESVDRDRDEPLGRSGWYADPWQRHALRFYDGWLWTEHVSDGGVAGLDSSPVADLERSRPRPVRSAPPGDAVGARVLSGDRDPGIEPGAIVVEPLLLVGAPDATGARSLLTPDDQPLGRIVPGPVPRLTRLGRTLVATPTTRVTRLRVVDGAGVEVVRLERPWWRSAAVVDVTGPDGPVGTVAADRVVRGLRARVTTAAGHDLGALAEVDGATSSVVVTAQDGTRRARLTPVWDVPGARRHLPPGALLLDRRPPPGEPWDLATAPLLLAALLAPTLLHPPH